MREQIALFDVEPVQKKPDNERRNWENGFQRWSNKAAQDGTTSNGACGYGAICDYCVSNDYGRPCVRALNAMCREKRISIDYKKTSYQNAWEGVVNDGRLH